jgi:hypothetical protein
VTHSSGDDDIAFLVADGQLTLSGGELDLTGTSEPSTATDFTLTGSGVVGGAGQLNLSGASNFWSGGEMNGADGGVTTVLAAATLHQTQNNVTLTNGRRLNVAGALTLEANTSVIQAGTPSLVAIAPTGLLRRMTATGGVAFSPALENDGVVHADSGTLNLSGGTGAGSSSGDYGAPAPGGQVIFSNGTHTLAGARLLGGVNISAGTVNVPAGATVTSSGPNTLSGAGTIGGTGNFNIISGVFTWSGGTMDGGNTVPGGATNVAAGATLRQTSGNVVLQNRRQLNVAGRFTLDSNTSVISAGSTPQVTVTAGGLMERTTTSGGVAFNPPLENDGVVHADSGTLNLSGGTGPGTSTGDYGAAGAGGEINFSNGVHALAGGARLLGHAHVTAGTVNVAAGATVTSTGPNSLGPSGTIGGTGSFDIASGVFTWSGGTMDGGNTVPGGATNVAAGATLLQTSGNVVLQNRRQLNVAGTFTLDSNTSVIAAGSTPQVTVNPTGLLQRTTATGGVAFSPPLDNNGVVHADRGSLNLSGGTSAGGSAGTYGAPSAGGEINFSNGVHVLVGGARLLGHAHVTAGTLTVPAGSTVTSTGPNSLGASGTIGGVGTFDIASGVFTWSGGTMDGGNVVPGGATNVAAGATLRQTSGNVVLQNRRELNNGGTFTLDSNTSVIAAGSTPQVTNTGLMQRTTSVGGVAFNPPLDSQGTIDVRRGTLNLNGGLTEGAGATLRVLITSTADFGRIGLSGTPDLAGTLAVDTAPSPLLAVGNQFNVITYNAHTGTFATVSGLSGGAAEYGLAYGQSAVTLTVTGFVDTTPPPAPTITTAPPATTTDPDAIFSFASPEPGVTFACRIDGGPFEACTSPKSYAALAAGTHTFDLRVTDAAGNAAVASRSWTVEAAQQPPKTLDDLPAPKLGVEANVEPVKGTVLIAVPAGGSRAGSGPHASQKGLKFVPLQEARQVPIGSFLDTRKGTVRLQSATGAATNVYQGDFAAGLFQVLQSRKKRDKGLTDLVLKGGSFNRCKPSRHGKGAQAALSKRTIRRVRGNAKGRFRTRGRHSAATVRGTKWMVADRCDGTLTQVTRGKVAVRDFRRKKTVLVKAGKSYLARAKR